MKQTLEQRISILEKRIGINESINRCIEVWATEYWGGSKYPNLVKIMGKTEEGEIKILKKGLSGGKFGFIEVNSEMARYGKKFGLTLIKSREPNGWNRWVE